MNFFNLNNQDLNNYTIYNSLNPIEILSNLYDNNYVIISKGANDKEKEYKEVIDKINNNDIK